LQNPPDPALAAASNPYDPAQNRAIRLQDASYFHGRYFTYFGPVPLVIVLWPWLTLTGHHAPADLVCWMFGWGAFLFQAATLLLFKRTWFPSCPPVLTGAAALSLGLGNLLQPLLRVHSTFEIPILSELFFGSACLFFFCAGSIRGRWGFWVLASLAYGLAAGSRINFAPCGLVLLAGFYWSVPRGSGLARRRRSLAEWAPVLLPAAGCLAALGIYNLVRFGSPLDFGNRYTLVEVDWRHRAAFSGRYVLANLYYYVFSWPRLSWYFPYFLESAALPFRPGAGYLDSYVDRSAGILPVHVFLLAGAYLRFGACRREADPALRSLLLLVAALSAGIALPLLFFIGSSIRYQAEFVLPLSTLAGLGVVALGHAPGRKWLIIPMLALAVVTAAANFFISCGTYGFFENLNPAQYRRLAQASDSLLNPIESLLGWRVTVPHLVLKFPEDHFGLNQPIWINGTVPAADFLYVRYAGPGLVQFGFEAMGRGGPLSRAVAVDYGKVHDLDLIAGPFLPPVGHPFYRRLGWGAGDPAGQILRIRLDGRIVMDALVSYHDGRRLFAWGRSDEEAAFGCAFTGRPFTLTFVPFDPESMADIFAPQNYGPIVLKVTWPSWNRPIREPLLTLGQLRGGETLLAYFLGDGRVRIGVVDQAGRETLGETAFVPPAGTTTVVADLPARYPGLAWARVVAAVPAPPTFATVRVNGRLVFKEALEPLVVLPLSLQVGHNANLVRNVEEAWSGTATPVLKSATNGLQPF
jgi:hypothetical protein